MGVDVGVVEDGVEVNAGVVPEYGCDPWLNSG